MGRHSAPRHRSSRLGPTIGWAAGSLSLAAFVAATDPGPATSATVPGGASSGVADEVLDDWVKLLKTSARDLVDAKTVDSEAAAVRKHFE